MIVAIGYLASLLLAISLIVTSALKFRWWNIFGCLTFIVYGSLIQAFPVILANTILLVINVYQLVKLYQSEETFELMVLQKDFTLAEKFVAFYKADIAKYFPNTSIHFSTNTFSFVVLRNMAVANLFVATVNDEGTAVVEVDYTIPQYRDYKSGKFIFDKERTHLTNVGIKILRYQKEVHPIHQKFLLKMGFIEKTELGKKVFVKALV